MAGGATARGAGLAGIVTEGGGMGGGMPGVAAAGRGCRGPDRIWPGRGGGGAGRAGIGPERKGGCTGAPPPAAKGGRIGAGLIRETSSVMAGEIRFSPGETTGASDGTEAGLLATAPGCSVSKDVKGASCSSGGSSTATAVLLVSACACSGSPPWTRSRTSSATGSSTELEWVFFSMTPSSGSMSRMVCDGTSSCLASSLIRILLIKKAANARLAPTN